AHDLEGALETGLLRASADVVAVIEDLRPGGLHGDHGLDLDGHAAFGALDVALRVLLPKPGRLLEREPERDVAAERVMRGGLLGDEVGDDAAFDELGIDGGRVGANGDRPGRVLATGLFDGPE